MSKIQVVQAPTGRQNPAGAPAQRPMTPLDTSVVHPVIGGSIDSVRAEVDDAFADMKSFHNREPDEVMRLAGGHCARLSEIRVKILRIEDFCREWKPVRQRDLEPTIEELKNQYQIASRLHSVRELDWKMESGER